MALLCAMWTEVEITTVQSDDSLARSFVFTILRYRCFETCHCANLPQFAKTVSTVLTDPETGCTADHQQVSKAHDSAGKTMNGGDRNRTCTPVKELDPKSSASANSATPPE